MTDNTARDAAIRDYLTAQLAASEADDYGQPNASALFDAADHKFAILREFISEDQWDRFVDYACKWRMNAEDVARVTVAEFIAIINGGK